MRPEIKDERQLLVVGCGRAPKTRCGIYKNHPAERWISVDKSEDPSPDIQIAFENLTEAHFKNINANTKFKIVFLEGMPADVFQDNPILHLNQAFKFVDEKGAFIRDNFTMAWINNGLNLGINRYIYIRPILILFKKDAALEEIVQIIKEDIHDFSPGYYHRLKELNEVTRQMEVLTNKYPKLDPMLISMLAHFHMYYNLRKDRKWRNFFKDKAYDKFISEADEFILKFAKEEITADALMEQFHKWNDELPSVQRSNPKLSHTTLAKVIDACENMLSYMQANKLTSKSQKESTEHKLFHP